MGTATRLRPTPRSDKRQVTDGQWLGASSSLKRRTRMRRLDENLHILRLEEERWFNS